MSKTYLYQTYTNMYFLACGEADAVHMGSFIVSNKGWFRDPYRALCVNDAEASLGFYRIYFCEISAMSAITEVICERVSLMEEIFINFGGNNGITLISCYSTLFEKFCIKLIYSYVHAMAHGYTSEDDSMTPTSLLPLSGFWGSNLGLQA